MKLFGTVLGVLLLMTTAQAAFGASVKSEYGVLCGRRAVVPDAAHNSCFTRPRNFTGGARKLTSGRPNTATLATDW